jgi:hypothetical protein
MAWESLGKFWANFGEKSPIFGNSYFKLFFSFSTSPAFNGIRVSIQNHFFINFSSLNIEMILNFLKSVNIYHFSESISN